MTTIDLRLQLAQEIENIPDSEQLLLRVINYVRGITKKGNAELSLSGDVLRLWNRTEELSALQQGWDGADALPMEKKSLRNMQLLLKAGVGSDFKNWVLFPDDNGTLLLQSKDGTASISIGNSSYSYVFVKDGKVTASESVRFTPTSVLNTLRTIAA